MGGNYKRIPVKSTDFDKFSHCSSVVCESTVLVKVKTKQPGASLLIMDADNMDVCMLQQLMEQKQTLSCILILQISIVQWWACDHIRAHQISGCARGHIQSVVKILAAISSSSQSTPVSKFSPVTALQLMIHQWWLLISSRASACRRCRHCHLPFMDKWIVIW